MAVRPALGACLYMSIHGPYRGGATLAGRVLDTVENMDPAAWRLMVLKALLLRVCGDNEDALSTAEQVIQLRTSCG